MLNQVSKLTEKHIPATLLGSAQPNDVYSSIENGDYQLVYTTPETFFDKLKEEPRQIFQEMSSEGKVSLIAIDEAHLIASWKSFR